MSATQPPDALLRQLRKGNRFLLTSHQHPDGDAVGSELALARILRRLGKSAVIWNRDPLPSTYQQLPGTQRIHLGEEPPAGYPKAFNAAIVLECPSLDRTGLESSLGELPLINIDHHLGNQLYGKVNWVDSSAPAVGEMIRRLAQAMTIELDAETATLLYLTLVTDTGGFRYSNATDVAFDGAAALVRQGASPVEVSRWLYESQAEGAVRLLGLMLGTLELHRDGHIATVHLTPEMYEQAGAKAGDAEGLIDHPRSIAGVQVAALFRQQAEGRVKVSLRSRGSVDVEAVAREHGGGGHHNAAGCEVQGELAEVRSSVLDALAAALDEVA